MKSNGFIIYEGLSAIDGKTPVVMIAIGVKEGSKNSKTGAMIQTYIMRSDINPVSAAMQQKDRGICGGCIYRKRSFIGYDKWGIKRLYRKRRCYVNLGQGPLSVYRAYKRGIYSRLVENPSLIYLLSGKNTRIGTYGDPLAIPTNYLSLIIDNSNEYTGYTHQWKTGKMVGLLMASVDNASERLEAIALGYKTFMVKDSHDDKIMGTICPSSKEYIATGKKKVTCNNCMLCDGSTANIEVKGHGAYWSDSKRSSLV